METKVILYIKGPPGSGKITVARILEKQLGWTLFWSHDLDQVVRVIGDDGLQAGSLARLMDRLAGPILTEIMVRDRNIIYVRPSRDQKTVESVVHLVDCYNRKASKYCPESPQYRVCLVNLVAKYETLLRRVTERVQSRYRVSDKKGLDEYLSSRPSAQINEMGEMVVNTDNNTPQEAAENILWAMGSMIAPCRSLVHIDALRSV